MLGWNSFDWEKSCALIILDSVGYHEFAEAETPNIDSFGRKRFEAFAQGTFTGPSIQAMMLGYLPWAGTETQIFGRELWLPNSFKERGYKTVALASLPYCQSYYFGRGFDIFRDMRRISMTTKMVKDTLKIVEPLEKFFLFMDIGATHRPYDYGETRTDWKERELQKYNYEGGEVDEGYRRIPKREASRGHRVRGRRDRSFAGRAGGHRNHNNLGPRHLLWGRRGVRTWYRGRGCRPEATQSAPDLPLVIRCRATWKAREGW